MRDCPPGFRRYAPILQRLGAYRVVGEGITAQCVFPERHKNGDRNPSLRVWLGRDNNCLMARCMACGASHADIVAAIGLPYGAWMNTTMENTARAKSAAVAEYRYTNARGEHLATKVRWEPGWDGVRKKDFSWWRPVSPLVANTLILQPGQQVIARGLGAGDYYVKKREDAKITLAPVEHGTTHAQLITLPVCRVGIYRLHEVESSDISRPIFVVEGEKDADRLAKLGFVATTGHAGKGKWETAWGSSFMGRKVVIIPDREPNESHNLYGEMAAASAMYYEATSIRIVKLPISELKKDGRGGDISDWLDSKFPPNETIERQRQSVIELVKSFPEYSMGAAFPHGKAA